ncbi:TerC family protein [Alterisphingorhabdus coralli]|uniref:TerC family protein n=1 Tax=Alterisphingorhabdus coralli TaxID=3071408 RepID=A0AA97F6A4_9SPHN|nr:TerC family protein [Parasphingorhabdus sp. SCSIO 66989]WOE75179.1 TerC family protein [Parasphingorhabdus sp. SCSIO 66989]
MVDLAATFSIFAEPAAWAALAALIAMEVVLGIDNLIFISIITNKLPETIRPRARVIGISLALGLRLVLLSLVFIIVQLTTPIFSAFGHGFSWRDLILIAGGLFLVWKATKEIHHNVDYDPAIDDMAEVQNKVEIGFAAAISQIIMLDLVFSLDSIITAVGMTDHIVIMVIAVIVAVTVMLVSAGPLARFLEQNPTVVMLALAFLFMIGASLIADGFGFHVPKEVIYGAMAFSALVEFLNILARDARRKKRGMVPRAAGVPDEISASGTEKE